MLEIRPAGASKNAKPKSTLRTFVHASKTRESNPPPCLPAETRCTTEVRAPHRQAVNCEYHHYITTTTVLYLDVRDSFDDVARAALEHGPFQPCLRLGENVLGLSGVNHGGASQIHSAKFSNPNDVPLTRKYNVHNPRLQKRLSWFYRLQCQQKIYTSILLKFPSYVYISSVGLGPTRLDE